MKRADNRRQIVLVDDEAISARVLHYQLERRGCACRIIASGSALLEYLAAGERPDLFLLDYFLGLDEPSGLALCRRIRAVGSTPVIMLTANGDTDALVACLKAGADEYVVKPCDIRELEARITAVLRRSAGSTGQDPVDRPSLRDDFSLNWQQRCICIDGLRQRLTEKELALLELFLSSPGHQVERAGAFQAIYGFELPPANRSIDVLVSKLRRKLAAVGAGYAIASTRGQGYRLTRL